MSRPSAPPGDHATLCEAFRLGSQSEPSFALAVALLDMQDAARRSGGCATGG